MWPCRAPSSVARVSPSHGKSRGIEARSDHTKKSLADEPTLTYEQLLAEHDAVPAQRKASRHTRQPSKCSTARR